MYKRTKPTVYLVHWPKVDVFKVGYTDRQRHRGFIIRGATLVKTMEFDSILDALEFEEACHKALWQLCKKGFSCGSEAQPYLGGTGSGYRECFRVPADLRAQELPAYIDAALAQMGSEQC